MMFSFAWDSIKNRRKSVFLTFISLVISISVLMSVEHIRAQAKESFNRTVSDVDLIVGAPSGQLNLLLYSVFRMGSPTSNISWQSFTTLNELEQVKWAIPISLGDSHQGYRVLGTSGAYFEHFKYGNQQPLTLSSGQAFTTTFEAVIGAEVAKRLNYVVGSEIIIAHGIGAVSFKNHDQSPFVVSGILAATGTPVDKTVHVTLAGIEAIHLPPAQLRAFINQQSSTQMPEALTPSSISAVMLGLESKMSVFTLQRSINNYQGDRLMAIMPGIALAELWQLMSMVENILIIISILILVSSLIGLAVMLLSSMRERRREIAILRVIGARPRVLFSLIMTEALLLVGASIVSALVLLNLGFFLLGGWLAASYGLFIDANIYTLNSLILSIVVLACAGLITLFPAIDAYKTALHSSLSSTG
ncbi:peptide ABC transporter permease [Glaciecola punicea]|jgi:putative ABC transport system permease protein|uniref:ABC transporter permease n=1 Tax=Glaciecola punicea TaxID=56804 RepID=UPI000872FEDD|nr:ABC transporter permease [Glaciecola punicea]OFA31918.1 peptide ABC transporter permease [Glaciecola punicea]